MLIEINLLPQKKAKNKSLFWLAIISSIILLIGGLLIFYLYRSFENKLTSIEQQISTTEQLVLLQQEKVVAYKTSNSFSELETTVEWAKEYPLKTVPVLKKLTALLPERGFIQSFTYEETGIINLTVQFETSREAAYYLNSIQESDWVTTAKILNLDAVIGFFDKTFGEEMDESKIKNEKYVPRYLAEFEITLNRDVLKRETEDKTTDENNGDET